MENRIYRTRIRGWFMKMRLTRPAAAQGAWLIVGRAAAGAVLVAVTVSACTAGGSTAPSTFTPTPLVSGHSSVGDGGTRTPSPNGQSSRSSSGSSASASSTDRSGASASGSPHASSSASASSPATARSSQTPTAQVTTEFPTPTPTHTHASAFPTAAPETGGGGTAGLQDGLLFGVGGLAVLVGFGTLAYRRRLSRKFAADDPGSRERAPRDPANRLPAAARQP
jgi:hypothetical protein